MSIIETLENFLSTEEGLNTAKKFFKHSSDRLDMQENQIDRFHAKHHDEINDYIKIVKAKYESKAFKNKWLKRGYYDPPNPLYSFLLSYAAKYGKTPSVDQYNEIANTFTAELFIIGDYYVELMIGQGSCINVFKIEK